jgi:hypothetical protein
MVAVGFCQELAASDQPSDQIAYLSQNAKELGQVYIYM